VTSGEGVARSAPPPLSRPRRARGGPARPPGRTPFRLPHASQI